jgi:hypothetical protein
MANVRIRPYSLYFNGRKLGQMHTADMTLMSGDEPQFGDGGFVGMSDGAQTINITCEAIQPATSQLDFDLVNALLNKQDVDVAIPIGPNIYMATVRCTKAAYKTDQKSGTLNGDFEFTGGQTKRT